MSEFIDDAVQRRLVELEDQYNGGKPFPAIAARGAMRGRPLSR